VGDLLLDLPTEQGYCVRIYMYLISTARIYVRKHVKKWDLSVDGEESYPDESFGDVTDPDPDQISSSCLVFKARKTRRTAFSFRIQ
jgi:hypothetical protein